MVTEKPNTTTTLDSPGKRPRAIPERNSTKHHLLRPEIRGKFLFVDDEKFWIKGTGLAPLRNRDGSEGSLNQNLDSEFEGIANGGINTVEIRSVPPISVLDAAARHGLRVIVGLPWERQAAYLDDKKATSLIEDRVRDGVDQCAGHPAVLAYAVGDRVSSSQVRWHGYRRVERLTSRLCRIAKATDPGCLVTYFNHPSTDFLHLSFLDFFCFDGIPGTSNALAAYLARLQNVAGEKPLVMSITGPGRSSALDESLPGDVAKQVRTAFSSGCAGVFVSPCAEKRQQTERCTAGNPVTIAPTENDLTALAAAREAFTETPFSSDFDWPAISVVVCSFNGATTIRDTLEGLNSLPYPNLEVIIVNDGSTDRTPEIAAEYDFKLISTENRGLSNARNTGWQAAGGEFIAYIDDDAYPDPHWLHYLAHTFMTSSYVGVGGPNIAPPGDGPIADCVANAPGGPVHVLLSDTEAEHIPGCNMAFRRRDLAAIDGFDPKYRAAGDDVDLCWRLQDRGGKIGFSAAAVVWHHRRNSVRMYWKQQQGYGKAEALLEEKWPEKYNTLGHYAWSGRLYGKGLTQALRTGVSRIYQGQSSTVSAQSMHVREIGVLASLPLMPEWFLFVAILALLALLGLNWPPLLWVTPLLIIAAAAPLAQAALSAAKAEFPTPRPSKWVRAGLRLLTAFLHLIQPLARLKGRLEHGLTPWRSRTQGTLHWRLTQTGRLRSGVRLAPRDWRRRLALLAQERKIVAREGRDLDDWDLEVRGGLLGSARLLLAVEENQTGGQNLRFRSWSRMPRTSVVVSCMAIVLTGIAGQQGALTAALVMGIGVFAMGTLAFLQSGTAHSALQLLLANLDQQLRSTAAVLPDRPEGKDSE